MRLRRQDDGPRWIRIEIGIGGKRAVEDQDCVGQVQGVLAAADVQLEGQLPPKRLVPFAPVTGYRLDQEGAKGVQATPSARATRRRGDLPHREAELTAGSGQVSGVHSTSGDVNLKTPIASEKVTVMRVGEGDRRRLHREAVVVPKQPGRGREGLRGNRW